MGKWFDLCVCVQSESTQVDQAAYVRYVGLYSLWRNQNSKEEKQHLRASAKTQVIYVNLKKNRSFLAVVFVACFHLLLFPFVTSAVLPPPPRSNVNLIIQLYCLWEPYFYCLNLRIRLRV